MKKERKSGERGKKSTKFDSAGKLAKLKPLATSFGYGMHTGRGRGLGCRIPKWHILVPLWASDAE